MNKTIEVAGQKYREGEYTEPVASPNEGAICAQCAFHNDQRRCGLMFDASPAVFGGDCAERDVIYVRVEEA